MQTALFKAAKAWGRIQGDPEPYVRRILYTENVSWWRRRRHVTETALGEYDGPAAAVDDDLRLTLQRALGQLTARQRTVLVLRYYEDRTEAQTAELLGIGVGTVKSSTRQALARLRAVAPHLGDLVGAAAMTQELRDLMHRVADDAPPVTVDDDTWAVPAGPGAGSWSPSRCWPPRWCSAR